MVPGGDQEDARRAVPDQVNVHCPHHPGKGLKPEIVNLTSGELAGGKVLMFTCCGRFSELHVIPPKGAEVPEGFVRYWLMVLSVAFALMEGRAVDLEKYPDRQELAARYG